MLVCVYLVSQQIVSFTGENSALSSPKFLIKYKNICARQNKITFPNLTPAY